MSKKPSPTALATAGAALMAIGLGISRFVFTPILPAMRQEAGMTPDLAGYLATANNVGYLLGALWPIIARKLRFAPGPRLTLLLGIALAVLTTFAMSGTASFPVWLLIRFAAGIASAWIMVFSSSTLLHAAAGDESMIARHYMGVGSGIVLSGILVAAMGMDGGSWRLQWIGAGVLILLLLLLVRPAVRATPVNSVKSHASVDQANARLPNAAKWLIAAYFTFGLGYVVTATFLPLIARQTHGIGPYAAFGWVLVGLVAIPSNRLWIGIACRLGVIQALMAAYLLEGVGVILPVLWATPWAIGLSAILLGGTFMGIPAIANAEARLLAPHHPVEIIAAMTSSFGVGQIIGPMVAGELAAHTGSFTGGLVTATVLLGIGMLMLWQMRCPSALTG